ncbi:MAG: class I SAM-dependent methyltransferase [Promethearchaeota archaeon]
MCDLRIKILIKKIIHNFFKAFTDTKSGSILFYHIVLKSRFGIEFIDLLTGNNSRNLIINVTNILASKKLQKLSTKSKNVEEIVDLCYNFRFSLPDIPLHSCYEINLTPYQIKSEIIRFLKLMDSFNPKIILEIGTAMGGTLFLFSRFVSSDAILISIDLLKGKIGGKNTAFIKSFAQKKQKIILIRSDSHKLSTFQRIKKILKNMKIDILFIDGDHTYEGVKKDFEMYKPLVKPEGLICFHDIIQGSNDKVGGVPNFWNEIRENCKTNEIIEKYHQEGYGIGIIFNS